MASIEVSRRRDVAAPADRIWAIVTDIGRASTWAPVVPVSEWVGAPTTGIGGERRCTFDPPTAKKWVRERVTEIDEASRVQVVEVVEGTARPPFERIEGITTVTPTGAESSTVRIALRTTTKGPMQPVLANLARPMLARTVRRLLAGLDHHVTTGAPVPDVGALRSAGVRI